MRLGVNLLCATGFANAAAQANDYCNLVSHPAFGITYDTFRLHIEEKDQVQAVTNLARRVQVLHVSEDHRRNPESGQIDFPAVFGVVKNTVLDGWSLTEALGSGVPELAAATRILRPMFDGCNTLYSESSRYTKDAWYAA